MDDLDHLTARPEDILSWCCCWKSALLTDGSGRDRLLSSTSNILVKINDKAVVKFGTSVTASEAANQAHAYNFFRLSSLHVAVPCVHTYFEHVTTVSRTGYLVMEFVDGQLLTDSCATDLDDDGAKLSEAVQAMWKLSCDRPGPIDGGEPRGPIWAPDFRAYESFSNKKDLENWFNRALGTEDDHIDLTLIPLVFCHLDLAPRNIIVGQDSTLYLLDWACAGFFPRFFEIWTLRSTTTLSSKFSGNLLSKLPEIGDVEEQLCSSMWHMYRLNMLHNLSSKLRGTAAPRCSH